MTKKRSGLIDDLQARVSKAHAALLHTEAARLLESEKAAAAERAVAESKAARERRLAQHQKKALDALEYWLDEFREKHRYVHIYGSCRSAPGEVVVTIGLPTSEDSNYHCFFRQEIRIRKAKSLRDVGIVFLPDRRFSTAEELDSYLRGDFLSLLAKNIAIFARDFLGEFRIGL